MEITDTVGVVLIVLIVFGSVFGTVIYAVYLDYKRRTLRSKEIIAAIEKGVEIPFPETVGKNYRNLGIIWTSVGIVITLALLVSIDMKTAVWGIVPVGVGVAYLLIARKPKQSKIGERS